MEIFNIIFPSGLSRWSIPFFIGIFFYLTSKFISEHINDQAKKDLSAFLISEKNETYLGKLPIIIYDLYVKIFGENFFSIKCFTRSLAFSLGSFFFVMFISWCFTPPDWKYIIHSLIHLPAKIWIISIFSWFLLCGITSFLFVGKTRFLLWVLVKSDANFSKCFTAIICDIFFSSWFFLIVTSSQLVTYAIIYNKIIGKPLPSSGLISNILAVGMTSAIFTTILMLTLISTGILYFIPPIANMFWSCYFSSLWLWMYVLLFIISRFILKIFPQTQKIISFMNIKEKPLECVGLIGGIIIFIMSVLFNLLFHLITNG